MRIIGLALASALALSACDAPTTTTSARNRVMDITNQTGVTMTHFYASNTGEDSWGPDQLGNTVLSSGRYMTINFDDYTGACRFDFRAKFRDGDVVVNRDINVCAETGWTYR